MRRTERQHAYVKGLRNFAPQAVRDVEEAAAWLAGRRGGFPLARRFVAAVVAASAAIARRPLTAHRRPDLLPDPFRFRSVQGFAHLLVYNAARDPPRVLRVLHMARDLGPLVADLVDARDEDPRSS